MEPRTPGHGQHRQRHGTLRLDFIDNTVADLVGNNDRVQRELPDWAAYTIDKTPPSVLSIVRVNSSPTAAATVDYTVTFSEPVLTVDTADFTVTATGVTGTGVTNVTGSGATRTVTVSTGTGATGTVRLDVNAPPTITDAVGNAETTGFTTGDVYTIDRNAPSVSSVVRASANPTNAASVNYTVTFSQSVTGVDSTDFTPTMTGVTGATIGTVTPVSGSVYTVAVNTGTGDGTIRLDVLNNGSIQSGTSVPPHRRHVHHRRGLHHRQDAADGFLDRSRRVRPDETGDRSLHRHVRRERDRRNRLDLRTGRQRRHRRVDHRRHRQRDNLDRHRQHRQRRRYAWIERGRRCGRARHRGQRIRYAFYRSGLHDRQDRADRPLRQPRGCRSDRRGQRPLHRHLQRVGHRRRQRRLQHRRHRADRHVDHRRHRRPHDLHRHRQHGQRRRDTSASTSPTTTRSSTPPPIHSAAPAQATATSPVRSTRSTRTRRRSSPSIASAPHRPPRHP